MGFYFDDRVFGGRDVFTMAAGAAVGLYWLLFGDAGGSGVVYCYLFGNIAGAKH